MLGDPWSKIFNIWALEDFILHIDSSRGGAGLIDQFSSDGIETARTVYLYARIGEKIWPD
jgi:hypothetical protein